MVAIESLAQTLSRRYPQAKVKLDKPTNRNSVWFLDMELRGRKLSVEWRPTVGYGLFIDNAVGQPNESFPNSEFSTVVSRINGIFK